MTRLPSPRFLREPLSPCPLSIPVQGKLQSLCTPPKPALRHPWTQSAYGTEWTVGRPSCRRTFPLGESSGQGVQKHTEDPWEGLEIPFPLLPSTCGLSVPISKAPGIDGESSQCWGPNPGPWHAETPHYDPLNTHIIH